MLVSPSIILNLSKFSLPSTLVKMSTIYSFVEQWHRGILLASTWCQIRWYFVLMCFVRSWNFRFLAYFIVEALPIMRGVECTCFSYNSSIIFLSHTISFVASAATTYSTSVVESAGIDCLRDLYMTALDPRLIT